MGILNAPVNPLATFRANTVIPLGDSITAQDCLNVPDYTTVNTTTSAGGTWGQGYISWALALSGYRLQALRNAGVSGQRTDHILARVQADVIAHKPGWCFVLAGANDIAQGIAEPTIIANLTAIYDKLWRAGIRVVALTIPPQSASSGGGQYAVRNRAMHRVNTWIKWYARTTGRVLLADVHPALADGITDAPLYPAMFRMEGDGSIIHPNARGAYMIGKIVAEVVKAHAPAVDPLPISAYDPDNVTDNAAMKGTAGSLVAGITGQVADSWILSTATGGTVAGTASKVARTDLSGASWWWQQLTATTGNSDGIRLQRNLTTGSTHSGGDFVSCFAEVEVDNDWTGPVWGPQLSLQFRGVNQGAYCLQRQTSEQDNLTNETRRLILGIPKFQVPAGTTRTDVCIDFKAATGTMRVGRVSFRNLTTRTELNGLW